MGCGCQKVQARAQAGAAPVTSERTFVVDSRGVREVTGMVLPDEIALAHQRAMQREVQYERMRLETAEAAAEHAGQATPATASPDPLASAQSEALLPSLVFGGVAGLVVGQTLLAGIVGLPVVIALGALGTAAYRVSRSGCSCAGGGCVASEDGPNCAGNQQACIDDCTRSGTVIGGVAGLGAGLLLERWSRRFPVKRMFFGI